MYKSKLSIPGQTPICNSDGTLKNEWRIWFNALYERTGGYEAISNDEIERIITNHDSEIKIITEQLINIEESLKKANKDILTAQIDIVNINKQLSINTGDIDVLKVKTQNNTKSIDYLNANAVRTVLDVGNAESLIKSKDGTILLLKTIRAGDGITIDSFVNSNELLIKSASKDPSVKNFGDLTINVRTVGPSPAGSFTLTGGTYWTNSRNVYNSGSITVPNYTSTSIYSSLVANSKYYCYLDYSTKSFKISKDPSAWSSLGANGKLLWIVTTNATEIESAFDYRQMNITLQPRCVMMGLQMVSGYKEYFFNGLNAMYNTQQIPTANEYPYAIGGVFPRYTRFEISALCLSAELGYAVGDEADYITGNADGIYGKPYRAISSSGGVRVFQGTNTLIWSVTGKAWVAPTPSKWAIILKATIDYQ